MVGDLVGTDTERTIGGRGIKIATFQKIQRKRRETK